jgi:UDP-N-acetylglucosamine 2-epimerase (non-hydrolysing)
MSRLKVLTLIGTRPEAIKLAPVIKTLEQYPNEIASLVCATAQHRGLLDQVLEVFSIKPDFDLNLMQPDQTLARLTATLLLELDQLFERERPDWVLVQGDTTTVMVASLVAFYRRIRIGHVEAGLRTGDRWQPFPEEINRRIADLLADLYFAPTDSSRQNLIREGVPEKAITVTGNTSIDALHMILETLRPAEPPRQVGVGTDRRLILVTAHRRENFGLPLAAICRALAELARRYSSQLTIAYSVHPNPNVQKTVRQMLGGNPNVTLMEPLGYRDFVQLLSQAYLVLTDSGGLQEEAPSLGIPVLVMREVTERPEGVAAGVVKLVGTDENVIVETVAELLENNNAYRQMARPVSVYGDGWASSRIVQAICAAANVDLPGSPSLAVPGLPVADANGSGPSAAGRLAAV